MISRPVSPTPPTRAADDEPARRVAVEVLAQVSTVIELGGQHRHHDVVPDGRDLTALARCPAGLLVHPVDEPRKFGIAFLKPDGTLEKLVEKPNLEGPQLANTGAYLFPTSVFDIELRLSPRGEYEITDYVTNLAGRQPFHVVRAAFWFPIPSDLSAICQIVC